MALAIALAITLITLTSCGLFLSHHWWFPSAISTIAPAIDHQFTVTFIVCGILFVAAQIGLASFAWRYRSRRKSARVIPSRGNVKLEISWTVAVAVIFIGLAFMGYRIWARVYFIGPAPGALRVEVWGEQFQWYFRYPGLDGQFGPVHRDRMNDSAGNYLGLDRRHDPAARDDIITTTLAVPVNRPVELILRSKDVIHSFFVRELRLKQDLVPGMEIPIHFTATRTGRYEIVCSQLCGLGHYKMHAYLVVMPRPNFQSWLRHGAKEQ
ncbi:MAG TPA: cytochrome c oxidase subunit II [Terriglobia bacterium]|nr:cytochrome c oxidase subunit II [Terriglobia bacterium]